MKTTENNGLHIVFDANDFTLDSWRKVRDWLIKNGAVNKNREWILKGDTSEFLRIKAKYIDEPLRIQAEKYAPRKKAYYAKYRA